MAAMAEYLLELYKEMPKVTRAYMTACLATTLAVLYFNPQLIFYEGQVWRLVTTFLYCGSFSFNLLFNLMFMFKYCRMLEEDSFHSRSADFLIMLLFGATLMIIIAPFVNLLFLGQAFTIMMVYVWSKRNPYTVVNLLGILIFRAPYMPWVLFAFSLLLGNSVLIDVIGIAVGHLYYFLEDVFPHLPGGYRVLKAPQFLVELMEPVDPNYQPLPQD